MVTANWSFPNKQKKTNHHAQEYSFLSCPVILSSFPVQAPGLARYDVIQKNWHFVLSYIYKLDFTTTLNRLIITILRILYFYLPVMAQNLKILPVKQSHYESKRNKHFERIKIHACGKKHLYKFVCCPDKSP